MLNEERVILMTKMEAYAQNEGKRNMRIGKYFRGDYISLQILKSVISATIAYVICFALYILYDLENFLQNIYKMDIVAFIRNALLYYGITVVAYGIISYLVYAYRYARARKSLKDYYNHLKKLNSLYQE